MTGPLRASLTAWKLRRVLGSRLNALRAPRAPPLRKGHSWASEPRKCVRGDWRVRERSRRGVTPPGNREVGPFQVLRTASRLPDGPRDHRRGESLPTPPRPLEVDTVTASRSTRSTPDTPSAERPPAGTRAAGRRLWGSVLEVYDLDEHERTLLREAVRTVDLLDQLDAEVRADGVMVESPQGRKAHPAAVEARQQRIALARLLAALRLLAGEESEQGRDRRPQRRTGVRGVYGVVGGVA